MVTATLYCDACGAINRQKASFCISCGQSLQAIAQLLQTPLPVGAVKGFPTGHLLPNHVLKQRYRLLNQLGRGGMGAVYKAEDIEFGNRLVAVKEMSQNSLRPDEILLATEAFKREALLLASLTHPNLPRTYDHFYDSGHWYLVMDFIEGDTLEAHLNKIAVQRLPVDEALDVGIQLCTILGYLHACQPPIIFRDLKPANVMLTPEGHLYLFDFGIARHFKPGQTRDTAIFGSVGYAAPEQYGKAQTTPRSDIYSLGVTLHQLLSGCDPALTPFRFKPLYLLNQLPPPALSELIMQMVDIEEAKRPASMLAVKHELQRIASQRTTHGQQTSQVGVLPLARGSASSTPAPTPVFLSVGTTFSSYHYHSGRVLTVAWSPNSKLIASGGYDQTVQVWDAISGSRVFIYQGHSAWVKTVAWSPDGTRIASGGADGTVQVWDALTGHKVLTYRHHTNIVSTLNWSPNGKYIASGGYDKVVHIWDAASGDKICGYYRHNGLVNCLDWSPDGSRLASASDDQTVQVWLATPEKDTIDCPHVFTYQGHSDKVSTVAWSPNGKRIASGSWDNTVHVWDTGGPYVFTHKDHTSWINALSWSPNGTRIASASNDKTVQVWEVSTGYEFFTKRSFYTYQDHTAWVRDAAWSPDGQYIASGGHDQVVRVWLAE